MKENSNEIVQKIRELGNEISDILAKNYTPHHKVEISSTEIKVMSDEWMLLSDVGERYLNGGNEQ